MLSIPLDEYSIGNIAQGTHTHRTPLSTYGGKADGKPSPTKREKDSAKACLKSSLLGLRPIRLKRLHLPFSSYHLPPPSHLLVVTAGYWGFVC